MTITKIITAALIAILFPNEQAMQNARAGVMVDIQQEHHEKKCDNIEALSQLSDALQCYTLDFKLQRKSNFIATGKLYDITETMVRKITTINNNPDNTQAFPYGNCHHHLILKTLDIHEPLHVHQLLITQCTDPETKEYIDINLTDNNNRYVKN